MIRRSRDLSRRRVSRLEHLESRQVLDGAVSAVVSLGDLVISGDLKNNAISVVQLDANTWRISNLDNTTRINGGLAPVQISGVTDEVFIRLKEGNDTVLLYGETSPVSIATRLLIDTGAGADKAYIQGVSLGGDLSVNMGAGNDRFATQLNLFEPIGPASVPGTGVTVGGRTTIDAFTEMDDVGVVNSRFTGVFSLLTGAGNDRAVVRGNLFSTTATINGGANTDKLSRSGNTQTGGATSITQWETQNTNIFPPFAVNDSIFTPSAQPVTVDVQANDSDPDGVTLTTQLLSQPAGGSAAVNPNGSITFTPSLSFTGATTFSYRLSDGANLSNAATVTIRTNSAPNGVNDTATVKEDTALIASGNVLSNDTDPEANPISVTQVAGSGANVGAAVAAPHGSFVIQGNGSYVYNLNNALASVQSLKVGQSVTDSVTYQVSDNVGASTTATLTVTIQGTNDGPVAVSNAVTVVENAGVPVTANVLTNDSDVDGDTLVVSQVAGLAANVGASVAGSFGSFQITAAGALTYTLNNANSLVNALQVGQFLSDTISHTISDGNGGTATAAVNVTIQGANDGPTAVADAASVTEETSLVASGNVLTNDTDVDGPSIVVSQVNGFAANVGLAVARSFGSFTILANGSFTYALNNSLPVVQALGAGETLTDAIAYLASDGSATSAATLSVTINGTNDAPTAVADAGDATEDAGVPTAGDVLTNDSDIDGDSLVVSAVAGLAGNVGANVPSVYGTFLINSNGSYTYTLDDANPAVDALNPGDTLTDSLSYAARDGAATTSASLTITIHGADHAPTAGADVGIAVEDIQMIAGGNVLSNDVEIDGQTLLVAEVEGSNANVGQPVPGIYGTFVIAADGAFTYTLDNANPSVQALAVGQTVTDSINYTVSDGGLIAIGTVNISIAGINDNPTANGDDASISEEDFSPAIGNALTNDTDIDGGPLSVSEVDFAPSNVGIPVPGIYGWLTVRADGSFSYTVNIGNPAVQALSVGESITDSFPYSISDGNSGAGVSVITITINGENDSPIGFNDTASVFENTGAAAFGSVTLNDLDIDGDVLTVTTVSGLPDNVGVPFSGAYGTVTINSNGFFIYTADDSNPNVNALDVGQSLVDIFFYTLSDGQGGASTAALLVTINGANDGPTVVNDFIAASEDTGIPGTGIVLINDSDPEGQSLSVSAVDFNPANVGVPVATPYGTFTIGADGSVSYAVDDANPTVNALASGATLLDSIFYTASDGNGGQTSATVTVTITGSNDGPTAVGDSGASVNEGTIGIINVAANDSDPDDGLNLDSIVITQQGTNGFATPNANGTVSYAHNGSETLSDSFTYRIRDNSGVLSSEVTVAVTINPVNDPPTAGPDSNTASENSGGLTTGNVLFNDTDPDGPGIFVNLVNGAGAGTLLIATYGTIIINSNGSYTYDLDDSNPVVDALGLGGILLESISYQVTDGQGVGVGALVIVIFGAAG